MALVYSLEPSLAASEFIDLLNRSTLAERRPVSDSAKIEGMLKHASYRFQFKVLNND